MTGGGGLVAAAPVTTIVPLHHVGISVSKKPDRRD